MHWPTTLFFNEPCPLCSVSLCSMLLFVCLFFVLFCFVFCFVLFCFVLFFVFVLFFLLLFLITIGICSNILWLILSVSLILDNPQKNVPTFTEIMRVTQWGINQTFNPTTAFTKKIVILTVFLQRYSNRLQHVRETIFVDRHFVFHLS